MKKYIVLFFILLFIFSLTGIFGILLVGGVVDSDSIDLEKLDEFLLKLLSKIGLQPDFFTISLVISKNQSFLL